MRKPKKVLVLGSGALQIGQAGEFDFSGSQCLKALREEGIETVLVNPNIATIQTDKRLADRIYLLPINQESVEEVIEKEKPDGILLGFGGQTALNCGIALHDAGILEKHNVAVLGTPVETIRSTEDRDLFARKLAEISVAVPKSQAVTTVRAAMDAAEKLGYPVMIRSAFSLGGQGSAILRTKEALEEGATLALAGTKQILVEECLQGWKEVEYEVVRDAADNCMTVCNMENVDPLGVHTGESIVVAPSQTLTNGEYHKLREIAVRTIRHLGVVGECNIQFALDPGSEEYRVIEVNARLSRSSALASKATGYPLALVATKLSLGYTLPKLRNSITKSTTACFEPALDYVVVKVPRWDLKKFRRVSHVIGTGMKSVGEVMGIGRTFAEAFQKALRMLDIGMYGFAGNDIAFTDLEEKVQQPNDLRIFAIAEAFRKDYTPEQVNALSAIDLWFLQRMQAIMQVEKHLKKEELTVELLREAKKSGFGDKQIAVIRGVEEREISALREKHGMFPAVRQIDTLAAEYPAQTNYLYLTYHDTKHDVTFEGKNKVIVLGSGAYRIGSSVEFDWCCVNAVVTLRELGYQTIMVNYNPETVSTDYDECDRLYFDELSFETVREICRNENAEGVIIAMGGQIPNTLAMKLDAAGIRIMGTGAQNIDNAEDRYKFSRMLDRLGIEQPAWRELTSVEDAKQFAMDVGYPVLVRPSYVLSGAAMGVAQNDDDLDEYLTNASKVNQEYPVVMSKFIVDAHEIEIDAVAKDGRMLVWAISEHIENAGVHSGDATLVFPPQKTYLETIRRVEDIAKKIADALRITGPFNIQFLAKNNAVKVIECNLRASRSFPFVSKVLKVNFADVAVRAMTGAKLPQLEQRAFMGLDYVGVKAPQFSFARLTGADPVINVEMASTGEVACLGENMYEALLKAMTATGFVMPKKGVLLSIGGMVNKAKLLETARKLHGLGIQVYATQGTSAFLTAEGVPNTALHRVREKKEPNIRTYLAEKKVDMVINVPSPSGGPKEELSDGYAIRRTATDFGITLITNAQLAKAVVEAVSRFRSRDTYCKSWEEYGRNL